MNYCGIDLDNADTGAITGSDAGGGATKTAESVVPETVAVTSWGVPTPGSITTINNLSVIWPTSGVNGTLSAAEKHILAGLNSDWINQSLKLVKDSFGLDFSSSSSATVKTINVKFENEDDNTLAHVDSRYYSTGKTYALDLVVNMKYYSDIDTANEDGALIPTSPMYYGAGYLDRTIAHEFTHSVMSANIDNFSSLPIYIKEGTAELVHGIDDVRPDRIIDLLTTGKSKLNSIFSSSIGGDPGDSDPYAAGYMLLRYLAKQGQGQSISKMDVIYDQKFSPKPPTNNETGIEIDFGSSKSANGSALTFPDSFDEQGFIILCSGCEQYINIVFDKDTAIGTGKLKSSVLSNGTMRRDYQIGIGGATNSADLAKAIFEGVKNSAGRDTINDIYVIDTDGTRELTSVSIDPNHNVRIAKNPNYPSDSNSEYIFLKERTLEMLFLDSGIIDVTGGKGSKDDAPTGTAKQQLDDEGKEIFDETGTQIPHVQSIRVDKDTLVKIWEAKWENISVISGNPLVIHSGTQAGQRTNYFIGNMQSGALTAGQIFLDSTKTAENLIKESDRARYQALSYDTDKQKAWIETLKKAEKMTIDDISVATVKDANIAIRVLDGVLEYALNEATTMGAYLQRLETTFDNVVTMRENNQASESTIRDADMAKEMSEYTKYNILLQSSQAMLSQANQNGSFVLGMLR